MKLLLDMNLSPRWVEVLTAAGFEVVHWAGIGAKTAPDSELMVHAAANDYVVLTHDLDFSAILAATHARKPSVVQIRAEDASPNVLSVVLVQMLRQFVFELEAGALLTFDVARTRVRVLPLTLS